MALAGGHFLALLPRSDPQAPTSSNELDIRRRVAREQPANRRPHDEKTHKVAASRNLRYAQEGPLFLKLRSVQKKTQDRYEQLINGFTLFLVANYAVNLNGLAPGELMDKAMCDFIHVMFWEGAPLSQAKAFFSAMGLHPREFMVSSKVHEYDDGLLLDGPLATWLGEIAAVLTHGRAPFDRLVEETPEQFRQLFRAAAERCNIMILEPIPYHLRHSGASLDLVRNWREIPAVKRRGRWASDRSMHRYLKGGRVAEQFRRLPKSVQEYCERCQRGIGEILSGRSPPLRV